MSGRGRSLAAVMSGAEGPRCALPDSTPGLGGIDGHAAACGPAGTVAIGRRRSHMPGQRGAVAEPVPFLQPDSLPFPIQAAQRGPGLPPIRRAPSAAELRNWTILWAPTQAPRPTPLP